MNAPENRPVFSWADPFLLEEQLSEEERLVHDSAQQFCGDKLMSRVLQAHREERFDREVFQEMGQMGFWARRSKGTAARV